MKATFRFLTAAVAAGSAMVATAATIEHTSFEEPPANAGYYTDLGDPAVDHALATNPGEPVVNWNGGGAEMGFSSYYTNTRGDVGLTDGDYVGVSAWTGAVGSYTDGVQGFSLEDCDGMVTTTFDAVSLEGYTNPAVSLDLFIPETGWETGSGQHDSIAVWVTVDGGVTIDLLRTGGSDIDDLGIEGSWMNLSQSLAGYSTATLHVQLDANASSEEIWLDNVVFSGDETPPVAVPVSPAVCGVGALLLGLAGMVSLRNKK